MKLRQEQAVKEAFITELRQEQEELAHTREALEKLQNLRQLSRHPDCLRRPGPPEPLPAVLPLPATVRATTELTLRQRLTPQVPASQGSLAYGGPQTDTSCD